MTNLTPQTQLHVAVKPNTPAARAWSAEQFDEITDLIAEALFQDFQAHRKATVKSPQGQKHTYSLTQPKNELK